MTPTVCVNDTDGDGDCAACARNPQAPCRRSADADERQAQPEFDPYRWQWSATGGDPWTFEASHGRALAAAGPDGWLRRVSRLDGSPGQPHRANPRRHPVAGPDTSCCDGTGFADYAAVPCPNPTCTALSMADKAARIVEHSPGAKVVGPPAVRCACPVDPDGPERGDPLSTCLIHGWMPDVTAPTTGPASMESVQDASEVPQDTPEAPRGSQGADDDVRRGVVKGCGCGCGQPAFIGPGEPDDPEPDEDPPDGRQEAERLWGHPLQYALIGKITIVHSEHMDDTQVRAAAGPAGASGLPIERFNRCPTCETWSPCDARGRVGNE